jgi:outer membrane lipoprotein-sorting protein
MAGKSQGLVITTLLVGLVGSTLPAVSEPVPLPKRAPQSRSAPAPAAPAESQPAQPAQSGNVPSWFPNIFGGGQQPQQAAPRGNAANFDATQQALVNKVSAYLSSVQVMNGDFIQVGPDGRRTKGQFYIQKPGKVRFEYEPPTPIDIVADGSSVVVRDRNLATQDLYPLSQTPLRFLLAERINLLRDTNVVGVTADEMYVTVVVEEKQTLIGTSRLMMMFGAKDYQLKQWVVTDPQGYDTTVAVSNIDSSRRPDPSMFKIDYTDYSRDR